MCSCGGELTVWCLDCGDWVCDDCGCLADHDAELRPEDWDDDHDVRHPYWHEGCGDCQYRAAVLEAAR